MTQITLQGKPAHTIGNLPAVGATAPDFTATKIDLSDVSLKNYAGKKIILSLFPSVDTGTCASAMRRFNEAANQLKNTVILCISADLPFAQKRFCGAENLENVIPLSVFRHPELGKAYGVTITDSPLAGLLSRAIVVIDETGKVQYTQQVTEIADEPDYVAALAACK
jgi:thioredoxin-dependent peroxiredoxin